MGVVKTGGDVPFPCSWACWRVVVSVSTVVSVVVVVVWGEVEEGVARLRFVMCESSFVEGSG